MKKINEFNSLSEVARSSIAGSLTGSAIYMGVLATTKLVNYAYDYVRYQYVPSKGEVIDETKHTALCAAAGCAVGTGIALALNTVSYVIKKH